MKVFDKTLLNEREVELLQNEVSIHKSMQFKGVIRFYESFTDANFIYIRMELCTRKTLKELLKKRKYLSEREVRYFAVQILLTVDYFHKKGVLHRDLKPGNTFLCDGLRTKIGDFGLAKRLEPGEKLLGLAGTPNYMAPEMLGKEGYSFPADIWSVGCIIFTLLNGTAPFNARTMQDIFDNITVRGYSWKQPNISKAAQDLVKTILQTDPSKRPTALECLRHPFFSEPIPRYLPLSSFKEIPKRIEYMEGNARYFYDDKNDI